MVSLVVSGVRTQSRPQERGAQPTAGLATSRSKVIPRPWLLFAAESAQPRCELPPTATQRRHAKEALCATLTKSGWIVKAFVAGQKPPPASYATAAYLGVNSFAMLNASGKKRFVRYRFVPVGAE